MTRLIDGDALEKAIYEWMPKDQETWMDSKIPPIESLVISIMMTIQEQPTVDAEPVIRCIDCKWFGAWYCDLLHFGIVDLHKYCAWAERKEE